MNTFAYAILRDRFPKRIPPDRRAVADLKRSRMLFAERAGFQFQIFSFSFLTNVRFYFQFSSDRGANSGIHGSLSREASSIFTRG